MNKTIGIVTIALKNSTNYGNRFQTFALQEFLRSNGYDPLTIYYESDYVRQWAEVPKERWRDKIWKQSPIQTLDDAWRIVKRKLFRKKLAQLAAKRRRGFEEFSEKCITYTDKCYFSGSDFSELTERCACFVTGSDQIWNPYYEGADGFAYLNFADPGKRIAYAPSIAVPNIPENLKEKIGRWISEIDYLSVRETEGKILLEKEFGIIARTVCDPVMLLSGDQWRKLAQAPEIKEKYFAVYMLGKKTVDKKRILRRLQRKYGLPALDVYTVDEPNSAFASPGEFLGILEHAEFVVTDSFHGLTLAMLLEKPVVVIPRYGMEKLDSRLEETLQLFRVDAHKTQLSKKQFEVIYPDYDAGHIQLNNRIQESCRYLLTAIEECVK